MQFVHPYFLFGLLAISIPIIIHLFNFHRYRKVYFTNVRFIRQLKQDTRKRSQLKHLIILLMRILTILFLVMAFAQPYIPVSQQMADLNRKNQVAVYLDNSFSMESVSGSIALLDLARNKARELAGAYRASDEFLLLTNDFESRHNRLLSRDEYVEQLDAVTFSPVHRDLSRIFSRLSDERFITTEANHLIYLITDLQKNLFDWNLLSLDSSQSLYLIPLLADHPSNVFIDSCWFENPVQNVMGQSVLKARVFNLSGTDLEKVPVRLSVNGSQKGLTNLDIPANRPVELEIPFINYEAGIHSAILNLQDFPITYDDDFYFSYQVNEFIPVLNVYQRGENPYLSAVFGKDSTFVLEQYFTGNLDYTSFVRYRLILLDGLSEISTGLSQELKRFVENGGSLGVFPGTDMDPASYNQFLASLGAGTYQTMDTTDTRTTAINLDHPVYRDVFEFIPENMDLPRVQRYFPITRSTRSDQEPLMTLENGNMLLCVQSAGNGLVYLSAVGLQDSFSNFQKHSVFVPTLYNMAMLSHQYQKLFYTIGEDEVIELRGHTLQGDQTFRISSPGKDFSFIPGHRIVDSRTYLYTHDQIRQSGNYLLESGMTSIAGISCNYDRRESLMEFYSPEEAVSLFSKAGINDVVSIGDTRQPFSVIMEELSSGIRLWKWFVVMALLCIAGEVLIIRFWK